mgnify:CR=1 FL=1
MLTIAPAPLSPTPKPDPELEIATEYQNTFITNYLLVQTFGLNQANPDLRQNDVYIDIQEEMDIATDINALIDLAAGKLLGGQISDALRTEIAAMLQRLPEADSALRAAETIYLIVTSPEYAYQR